MFFGWGGLVGRTCYAHRRQGQPGPLERNPASDGGESARRFTVLVVMSELRQPQRQTGALEMMVGGA